MNVFIAISVYNIKENFCRIQFFFFLKLFTVLELKFNFSTYLKIICGILSSKCCLTIYCSMWSAQKINTFVQRFSFMYISAGWKTEHLRMASSVIYRSAIKRSLSDGICLSESKSPVENASVSEHDKIIPAFPDKMQDNIKIHSESAPEILTCKRQASYCRSAYFIQEDYCIHL